MTTLFSWTGIDTHGPASIYIASDSRISWGSKNKWDVGRKLFASKRHPEIFGYCGSVSFPIQILGQLIELIDCDLMFNRDETIETKVEKVRFAIEKSYRLLPSAQKSKCEILYATRLGNRMQSNFHVVKISVNTKDIQAKAIALPAQSGIIVSAGSGQSTLGYWHEAWVAQSIYAPLQSGRTSRYVFSAFCDSLKAEGDPFSGGAPQLIGLYRKGPANNFGIIHKGKRFLNGAEVPLPPSPNVIEWRNELFERCCGESMTILKKAQRQPRPRDVKLP